MLILLHGEDTFRLKEKYKVILERYNEKNPNGLGFLRLADDVSFEKVREFFATSGMFEEKKLLVLDDFMTAPKKEVQESVWEFFVENNILASESDIILILQSTPPDKRTSIYKNIIKHARAQEFKPLSDQQISAWIHTYCKEDGCTIANNAVSTLLERTGPDMWRLTSELEKLVAYKGKGEITHDDVNLLVARNHDIDVFALTDAFVAGNTSKAVGLLKSYIISGEAPQRLIGLLFYQIRTLISIKFLLQDGVAPGAIAKQAGIHPFVVRKTAPIAQRLSLPQLKFLYNRLLAVESGIITGKYKNPEIMLEVFVLQSG